MDITNLNKKYQIILWMLILLGLNNNNQKFKIMSLQFLVSLLVNLKIKIIHNQGLNNTKKIAL